MRAELITVLKSLTEDQQYDIAAHLANNIGYKLVHKKENVIIDLRLEQWEKLAIVK